MVKREPTYEEKLKEFWKYNIHPITGYGAVSRKDGRHGKIKRDKDN